MIAYWATQHLGACVDEERGGFIRLVSAGWRSPRDLTLLTPADARRLAKALKDAADCCEADDPFTFAVNEQFATVESEDA